jgi:hypothetical protein
MPLLPIIGLLTLGTALTHISLLFPDPVFIANGLGYLGLFAALWRGPAQYRNRIRWVFVGYTLLTIALWVAFGERSMIGYLNKLNEVLLGVSLVAWKPPETP